MNSNIGDAVPTPPFSILILNGPNLAYVGKRQPEIYGSRGLDEIPLLVKRLLGASSDEVTLSFYHNNSEGALIDRLEQARAERVHGVAFNAGAYTHTSLALADCLAWIRLPVVEVHISNVFAREEAIRRQSFIGAHAIGIITGFGILSYALAVQALHAHLSGMAQN